MVDDLVLTDSELEIVLKLREKNARATNERALKLDMLRLAAEYEFWLQNNCMSSTFSTFMDGFGYGKVGAPGVFRRVEAIREAALNDCSTRRSGENE